MSDTQQAVLTRFELEIELKDGEEKEWEFEAKDGWYRGRVEYEGGGQQLEWKDTRALREVLRLMDALDLRPEAAGDAIARQALATLGVQPDWVGELELEVAFADGRTIAFEYEAEGAPAG